MDKNSDSKQKNQENNLLKTVSNIIIALFWVVLIIVCIINRDIFTVQNIVDYSPTNAILAVLMLWVLFAVKSLSIVIYSGILYAASGILFPLYIAIPVNLVGTAIMITIPFFLGKRYGTDRANELMEKYPKLKSIHEVRSKNDFFFSYIIRIAGRLPSDPVSMYMGATNTNYLSYLPGSILGMLPETLTFTIMGTSITNIKSPLVITVVAIDIIITVISILFFVRYTKRIIKEKKS